MCLTRRQLCVAGIVVGSVGVSGCLGNDGRSDETDPDPGPGGDPDPEIDEWSWSGSLPVDSATQYHDADCDCCGEYVAYLETHGIDVDVELVNDLSATKTTLSIPDELRSCHTTALGDYLVEGHVPLEAIETLFADEPSILGIAIPGMPQHAPGMGEPGDDPLSVYAFDSTGAGSEYTRV